MKRLDVASGVVTLLGSTASAEFADVAVNGTDVFAVDSDGNRVVRFPAAGGAGATVIGSGLTNPTDLAFRSATRLLVADTGSDRVLEYLNSGGSWVFDRVVLPASSGVQDPCALAIAPSGALTVGGCLSNNVVLVDLTTLAVTTLIAPGAGGLASPKDLAWSGSTLLVANPVANAVVYYDASGAATGVRAQGITPALDGGIAVSADESRVAVASSANDAVLEYAAGTGAPLRTIGGACGGQFPSDVAYGPGGDLFVACFGSNSVNRINAATGAVSAFVSGGSGGLFAPRALAFGPNGNLFVTGATGELLQFNGASGSFVNAFVDAAATAADRSIPTASASRRGALFVTSHFTDSVAVFSASTGAFVATRVASGSGGLDEPTGIAFASDGSLLVASRGDDSVRRYDAGPAPISARSFRRDRTGSTRRSTSRCCPSPRRRSRSRAGALFLAALARAQEPRVSRRTLAITLSVVLGALAAIVWLDRPRGPHVVAEGAPLPLGEKVEMRFQNEGGETETWKLEKKETTREEALAPIAMPEPDPDAAAHAPNESARALDGPALETWKHGDIAKAVELFEQSVAADPDDRVPRSHAGRLLTLMTDYERALPHLERAAALAPDDPQVWLDLQTLYERPSASTPRSPRARAPTRCSAAGASCWTNRGSIGPRTLRRSPDPSARSGRPQGQRQFVRGSNFFV